MVRHGCFENNKGSVEKPIGNPFYKDLEKVASLFYATNFLDSIDSRGLWNVCAIYGRFVDAFIANKRSKRGKVLDLFVLWILKTTMILLDLCPTYGSEYFTCIIC